MKLAMLGFCLVAMVVLAGCSTAPVSEEKPAGGDPKGLLGKWRVVAFQSGGVVKTEKEYRTLVQEFEFAGNTITITRENDRELWGPFEVDAAASPPQLILHVMLPPVSATYDLKDDTLRLCYFDEGDWRVKFPETLVSRSKPHSELITLKRML